MEEAGAESLKRRNALSRWTKENRVGESNLYNTALKKLTYDLHKHKFYTSNNLNEVNYPVRGKNPIEHPLPDKDEGVRLVNLISYIYANCNPKYAQQILTIFRTFYNFCWTTKLRGEELTPAQSLGLTDKVFDCKDIIYFR